MHVAVAGAGDVLGTRLVPQSATVLALQHGGAGIFNIVEDKPAPGREWLPVLAATLGAEPPRALARRAVHAAPPRMPWGSLNRGTDPADTGSTDARARDGRSLRPTRHVSRSRFSAAA
jgi:hypothetical protein